MKCICDVFLLVDFLFNINNLLTMGDKSRNWGNFKNQIGLVSYLKYNENLLSIESVITKEYSLRFISIT